MSSDKCKCILTVPAMTFKCVECKYGSNIPLSVPQHNNVYDNKRNLICSHNGCHKTFTRLSALKSHLKLCPKSIKTVTRKKKIMHSCSVCHKVFDRICLLDRHFRIHTKDKPFSCHDCGAAFNQKNTLKIHIELKHGGNITHPCHICAASFKYKSNLTQHQRVVHTNEIEKQANLLKCPHCPSFFKNTSKLSFHHATYHQNLTEEQKIQTTIKDVMKGLQSLNDLSEGQLEENSLASYYSATAYAEKFVNGVRWYKCKECDVEFKKPYNLQRHAIIHTTGGPYECSVCDQTFRLKTMLIKHNYSVHNICDKTLTVQKFKMTNAENSKLDPYDTSENVKKQLLDVNKLGSPFDTPCSKFYSDTIVQDCDALNQQGFYSNFSQNDQKLAVYITGLPQLQNKEEQITQEVNAYLINFSVPPNTDSAPTLNDSKTICSESPEMRNDNLKSKIVINDEMASLKEPNSLMDVSEIDNSETYIRSNSSFINDLPEMQNMKKHCGIKLECSSVNIATTSETQTSTNNSGLKINNSQIYYSDPSLVCPKVMNDSEDSVIMPNQTIVQNDSILHLNTPTLTTKRNTGEELNILSNSSFSKTNNVDKEPKVTILSNDRIVNKDGVIYLESINVNSQSINSTEQINVSNDYQDGPNIIPNVFEKHVYAGNAQANIQIDKMQDIVKISNRKNISQSQSDIKYDDQIKALIKSAHDVISYTSNSMEHRKVHKCMFCNKTFNKLCSLIIHTRAHTQLKVFKCDVCEKSFTFKSSLRNHKKLHLSKNERQKYHCKVCAKQFYSKGSLKAHNTVHYDILMHQCPYCILKFRSHSLQKQHIRKNHIDFVASTT